LCYRLHDAESGFVVIIDRRNDKWNSVKTTLIRISVVYFLSIGLENLKGNYTRFNINVDNITELFPGPNSPSFRPPTYWIFSKSLIRSII